MNNLEINKAVSGVTGDTLTGNAVQSVEMDALSTEISIEDEAVPTAVFKEEKFSWWWIFLILVFGMIGAEIRRRVLIHQYAKSVETTKESDTTNN